MYTSNLCVYQIMQSYFNLTKSASVLLLFPRRTQTRAQPSRRCRRVWMRTTTEKSASRNTSPWLATWPTASVRVNVPPRRAHRRRTGLHGILRPKHAFFTLKHSTYNLRLVRVRSPSSFYRNVNCSELRAKTSTHFIYFTVGYALNCSQLFFYDSNTTKDMIYFSK